MSGDTLNSSLKQLNWLLAKNGSQSEKKDSDKPNLSYSQLIREAIENSPDKKCTLSSIYEYIATKYKYYAACPTITWKNSIRHNLSLNKQFTKLDKAVNGKGSFWTLSIYTSHPSTSEKKKEDSSTEESAPSPIPPSSNPHSHSPSLFITPHLPYPSDDLTEHIDRYEDDPTLALPPGMSLFDSHDLSSSFRNVYDQVFHNKKPATQREEEARIDWLKIGLETAGIDYTNTEEMANVRADGFIEMLNSSTLSPSEFDDIPSYEDFSHGYQHRKRHNGFIEECNQQKRQCLNEGEEEDEDDFDWDSLLSR
ncbi:fkh-8 [Pristionchus pacificus]|uniref:Fkh-8 n=1 Tax=Pristionchus pacificus TaxID=54126 RepID=A0A2A6BZE5_PRIPA|nr:fkh-8 [Pristionchus pacificus]|eukprot:PDM71207.1 fkh-8 [Pristionchus pacificus]